MSKKQPNTFLGVDLSNDAIKVVELKNFQGRPQLSTYGYSKTKPAVMRGAFIENINVTSTLIKEVMDRAGCTGKQVLAALPISKTFTYVMRIQKIIKKDMSDTGKIKGILSAEIKKILPMPVDEMQFDFTVVNADEFKSLGENDAIPDVKFLITAAANSVVKVYTEIFKQAGLELLNLDIESFALVRSLIGNDKSLIMLVDFGEHTTDLSMVVNGVPVFNRSIEIGGAAITKKLADTMGVSLEEAEQYKLDLPILMQQQGLNTLPKPIELSVAPVVSEIKFLIKNYYQQVSDQQKVDRIILTGGGAALAGFADYVSLQTDVRTYIGDPWARIIYPQELSAVLRELGPRFAVAIGLAMTRIR